MFNLLTLSLATYDLLTNPESTLSEVGMDVAIHALSFLSLRENSSALTALFASGANMFRVGAIYAGVTSGATAVPLLLNVIDVGNHLVNAGAMLVPTAEDTRTVQPK